MIYKGVKTMLISIIKIICIIITSTVGLFYTVGSVFCLINNIKTNNTYYIPTDFNNDILPYLFTAGIGLLVMFLPLIIII